MLLKALNDYAHTYLPQQLADLAFEEKPVPYAVEIYDDGTFAGIRPRFETDTVKRGKKEIILQIAEPLLVPKSPVNRNTGLHPLIGCDGIQYVLGAGPWTDAGKEDNHRERHEAFGALVARAADETGDAALNACATFYGQAEQVEAARAALIEHDPKPVSLITLSVVPKSAAAEDRGGEIVRRTPVREWWRRHYETAYAARLADGGEAMCLITGAVGPVAPTHEKIKGAASLGGQPAGVSLMSFDKSAFCSYGWKQNANSPVSPEAAAGYVLAMNDLLHLGKHRRGRSRDIVVRTRFDFGGVGFLFWTGEPTDDDLSDLLNEADPQAVRDLPSKPLRMNHTGKNGADPDAVYDLLRSPETGRSDVAAEPNDFFFVAVSGNGGRLLVRYWFCEPLTRVHENIGAWFEQLRIADVFSRGQTADPPKLWELLSAMTPSRVKASDAVNAERAVQLLRRALHGVPLGRTILAAALARQRAERESARLSPARVGLVRLCHNDVIKTLAQGGPIMSEALNPDETDPAYICGRLMALYEGLQYQAHRDDDGKANINVTVTDRYYGLASTFPSLTFPKLEHLSKAHLKKLRRTRPGTGVNIGRDITQLVARLQESPDRNFPKSLSLEAQGRFIIGYHHQKAIDQQAAASARNDRNAEAASAD